MPAIGSLARLARFPQLTAALGKHRLLQNPMRLAFPFPQTVARARVPTALLDDWFYALDTGDGLGEWRRYVVAQDRRWTMEAVSTLQGWRKPAHVIWATNDRFLPVSWAMRLTQTVPTADDRPTLLPDAGHFFHVEVPATAA